MSPKFFHFGETVSGYAVPVLNEREVRAAAGILFLFALVSFMHAWLVGDFQPIKLFVTVFMLDFIVRVLVNPEFSPSLLLGRAIVARQNVEYVGAAQKRFAWALGLGLSTAMFFLVVVGGVIGPINLLLCLTCLTLLFFESAFGICIGCKAYTLITKAEPELCPGGVCEVREREAIQRLSSPQSFVLAAALVMVFASAAMFLWLPMGKILPTAVAATASAGQKDDCVVPDWAKAIGHEEMYRLHHGCLPSQAAK